MNKIFVSSERYDVISMIFAVKMSLLMLLNVTKNHGFTLSLKNTTLEPNGRKVKLTPQHFYDFYLNFTGTGFDIGI